MSTCCIAAMLSLGIVVFADTTEQTPPPGAPGQAGGLTTPQARPVGDRNQTPQQITLVGCVQREAEYRQAHQGGRGGTLGTGVGAGNEFVLINALSASASTAPAAPGTMASGAGAGRTDATTSGTAATGTTTGTSGRTAGTATGTASAGVGTAGVDASAGVSASTDGKAYSLSGSRERDLEQHIGQRVEIVGTLEAAATTGGSAAPGAGTTSATGAATGTASTGATASGSAAGTTATGTGTMAGSGITAPRFGDLPAINIVSFRAIGGSCTPR